MSPWSRHHICVHSFAFSSLCCGLFTVDTVALYLRTFLPDARTHTTCIHNKLYGLENPCPWKHSLTRNGRGVSGEKVRCPLSVGTIVLYHCCQALLNDNCSQQRRLDKRLFLFFALSFSNLLNSVPWDRISDSPCAFKFLFPDLLWWKIKDPTGNVHWRWRHYCLKSDQTGKLNLEFHLWGLYPMPGRKLVSVRIWVRKQKTLCMCSSEIRGCVQPLEGLKQ